MHRLLTDEEKEEIGNIKERGRYKHTKDCWKTHIEYLSLALLKYLVYTKMTTWRQGFPNQFKGINDKLSRGERSKAVSFLIKNGAVYRKGKRLACSEREKLITIMDGMEKELTKKENNGEERCLKDIVNY